MMVAIYVFFFCEQFFIGGTRVHFGCRISYKLKSQIRKSQIMISYDAEFN